MARLLQHEEGVQRGISNVFVDLLTFDEALQRGRVAIVNRTEDSAQSLGNRIASQVEGRLAGDAEYLDE